MSELNILRLTTISFIIIFFEALCNITLCHLKTSLLTFILSPICQGILHYV